MVRSSDLEMLRKHIERKKGEQSLLLSQKKEAEKKKTSLEEYYENTLNARIVVQLVAEGTQKHLEYQISSLVSAALASVFPDPYTFELRFVQRRNKTEADMIFIKNGNETDDILNSGGGGVADISANISLPFALWSIKKTRPFFLIDEPTKYLHNPLYQEKASAMIKEVSKQLRIQILMVSDQDSIIKSADRVFVCENKKGVAYVTQKENL